MARTGDQHEMMPDPLAFGPTLAPHDVVSLLRAASRVQSTFFVHVNVRNPVASSRSNNGKLLVHMSGGWDSSEMVREQN